MKKIFLVAGAALLSVAASAQPQLSKNNIDEVLKAMTLEEKATLICGSGWGSMMAGSMTASDASLVPGAAGTTQAIKRLGIPQTVVSDGPAGLRIDPTRPGDPNTYYCTGYPVGTVLACTWDVNLVEELLKTMGNEVKEYGADVLLAPGQNIHRSPLCGRNFEYFSEDPILSGKISAAYVKGIQANGVGTSIKHFMANNQEINRQENDAHISQRALREIYLKNFEITVKESDPWTIMSSYNKANGKYTQQNHDLLTTILRDEWGYKGIVMTDWGAKADTPAAVHAGNDLMEPGSTQESQRVIDAVKNGTLDVADLDRNVKRLLEYIVRTPRFQGYKYSNKPDLTAHAALVRKAATEGMVLLKNEGNALPMEGVKKVALFGLNAYKSIAGGTGSGNVNKPYIRHIDEGIKAAGIEVDAAIANYYKTYREFSSAETALNGGSNAAWGGLMLGEAVLAEVAVSKAAIKNSVNRNDAAIVVIGRNAGEGDDRRVDDDWDLTTAERDLINQTCNAYHEAGKKVIVVLNIGGVIETASWKNQPDAILLAWTPGQEVGNSVADILTGKANPAGKLSMTFPVSFFEIPSSANFPYNGQTRQQQGGFNFGGQAQRRLQKDIDYTEYEEGIYVGYRYFNTVGKEVSYPFGYGLSYTTFSYSSPVVKATKDGGFTASIVVKNTGKVAGKEAVQVYVSAPAGGLDKPSAELKAFAKTKELKPGESQTVTFAVDGYTLASFNEAASQWEEAAGNYSVQFGASSRDIRAKVALKVAKAQTWKVNNVFAPEQKVNEIKVK
ncbi:MAG: glycoside hydrolase family 3 C-terminal domain-containing protein [Bacteroidales bacterium]|nr:glycoside hydrolase family 3 C-terminal domain-containing protein [Bacteroidales bacterium]